MTNGTTRTKRLMRLAAFTLTVYLAGGITVLALVLRHGNQAAGVLFEVGSWLTVAASGPVYAIEVEPALDVPALRARGERYQATLAAAKKGRP